MPAASDAHTRRARRVYVCGGVRWRRRGRGGGRARRRGWRADHEEALLGAESLLRVVVLGQLGVLWRDGRDELGARECEELLVRAEVDAVRLHAAHTVAVLVAQRVDEILVDGLRREGGANGQQCEHLLVLLEQRLVLVRARVVLLGARDVEEDARERLDRVRIPPKHEVGPADIIEEGHVAGGDARVEAVRAGALASEVDELDGLEGGVVVGEQAVHAQQPDEREVAKHLVERRVKVGARCELPLEMGLDLRPVDEGLEVLEDLCGGPHVGLLVELGDLLLRLVLDARAELAEDLELVDELVGHIPQPLVGQRERDGLVASEQQVEDGDVIQPRLEALLERRLQLRVDVPVVQLLVQQQELLVTVNKRRDGLSRRPRGGLVVFVGELVEGVLIDRVHLVHLPLLHHLVEEDDKRANHVRHIVRLDRVIPRRRRVILLLRGLLNVELRRRLQPEVGQVVHRDLLLGHE